MAVLVVVIDSVFSPGFVVEYLSLVPQDRKFVSATTGDIIFQSVWWMPDFSLVKVFFQAVDN